MPCGSPRPRMTPVTWSVMVLKTHSPEAVAASMTATESLPVSAKYSVWPERARLRSLQGPPRLAGPA
jgi:hypothetical protein